MHKVIQSKNRVYIQDQLLNLLDEVRSAEQRIASLVLERQRINAAYLNNINLNGILVDSFNSLNGSDYNNLSFSCFVNTKESRVEPYKESFPLTFQNASITKSTCKVATKNLKPYYITSNFSPELVIEQSHKTSIVNISNNYKSPSVEISPSYLLPDVQSKAYNLGLSTDIQSGTLLIKAHGFNPLEDNLIIRLGTSVLSAFTFYRGSSGTLLNSVKADQYGIIELEATLPSNLPLLNYPLVISNELRKVSNFLYASNTTNAIPPEECISQSSPSISQPFSLSTDSTIVALELIIPSFDNLATDIFNIYITQSFNGLPSKTLSSTSVQASDITQSSNNWSLINLSKPTFLPAGEYHIVISAIANNTSLYVGEISQRDLTTGATSNVSILYKKTALLCIDGKYTNTPYNLCYRLYKGKPPATSSLEFTLSNPTFQFSRILSSLPVYTPPGTTIGLFYKQNDTYVPLKQDQEFPLNVNSIDIKIILYNTSYSSPIIDTASSFFTLASNSLISTWVSSDKFFDEAYQNIEASFDYYIPPGSAIGVYISSNQGQTWDSLTMQYPYFDSNILSNANIPTYKNKFIASLSQSVKFNNVETLRTSLRVKIVITIPNSYNKAYISNLTVTAH